MAAIPDGGWGWMVVLGSFMIHVIADGIAYTFGIFFVEIVKEFNESKGYTAWIASILVGVTLGTGPLASALTNLFGCRVVTIYGTLIAGLGFILSTFAQNVLTLFLTVGLMSGVGFGLIYLPAIVSVSCYFEKRRSFATGIAVCGSGIGTFIFAPFVEHLIDLYTWRGAILILGGIIFNCIIFGALFIPLDLDEESDKSHSEDAENKTLSSRQSKSPLSGLSDPNVSLDLKLSSDDGPVGIMVTKPDGTTEIFSPKHDRVAQLKGQPNIKVAGNPIIPLVPESSNHYLINKPDELQRMAMSTPSLAVHEEKPAASIKLFGSHEHLAQPGHETRRPSWQGLMYRKDIFYSGSISRVHSHSTLPPNNFSKPPSSSEPHTLFRCCRLPPETYDTLSEMMNISIMKDVIFILFALSNFLTSIGFNVPYVYMKDRAMQIGISSEESSYLLSVVGIANTVGRVILGYVSDKPWVNRLHLYNCALITCGLATAFSSYCSTYTLQVVYSSVFGITSGVYVGLTSVIIVDFLGLDKLTNAFGMILLFQGIASLLGPPIAGWLYDSMLSYDPGFYLAGFTMALSGIILIFVPMAQRLVKKEKEKAEFQQY